MKRKEVIYHEKLVDDVGVERYVALHEAAQDLVNERSEVANRLIKSIEGNKDKAAFVEGLMFDVVDEVVRFIYFSLAGFSSDKKIVNTFIGSIRGVLDMWEEIGVTDRGFNAQQTNSIDDFLSKKARKQADKEVKKNPINIDQLKGLLK